MQNHENLTYYNPDAGKAETIANPFYDKVVPEGKWEFDESVTSCFDNMLERSIPDYKGMRKLCFDVGSAYVKPHTFIVDLGCSRGEALWPFVERFGAYNRFIGVEVSEPMLEAAKARYGYMCHPEANPQVMIQNVDLRKEYPLPVEKGNGWHGRLASLTLCVLTLQFVPIEHRQKILANIYRNTIPGGALILVEKVLGSTAELDGVMVDSYYDIKKSNGYSQEDIERKKMALEGVLVPVTAKWNDELLRGAGFRQVDCFWRYLNFAGWVAVK